ncbi:hypothetical protein D3C80_2195040 [compost metagenome]
MGFDQSLVAGNVIAACICISNEYRRFPKLIGRDIKNEVSSTGPDLKPVMSVTFPCAIKIPSVSKTVTTAW